MSSKRDKTVADQLSDLRMDVTTLFSRTQKISTLEDGFSKLDKEISLLQQWGKAFEEKFNKFTEDCKESKTGYFQNQKDLDKRLEELSRNHLLTITQQLKTYQIRIESLEGALKQKKKGWGTKEWVAIILTIITGGVNIIIALINAGK